MRKLIMGYILIAIGAVLVIAGYMMIKSNTHTTQDLYDSEQQYTEAETCDNEKIEELSAKDKGDAFENFIVNLLADHRFKLMDRTQDVVSTNGVVAESCKNPDLHIQQKRGISSIDYYIECKYRSNWNDGKISLQDWQIKRYRQFQRETHRKVIIAFGVGGTPDNPETVRLVPLDSIKGNSISKIKTEFAVEMTPSGLYNYVDDYFTTVFDNSKSTKKK